MTVEYRTRFKCVGPHPLAVVFLVVGLILLASEYFRRNEGPIMPSCPIGFKADELMKARDRLTDICRCESVRFGNQSCDPKYKNC